MKKLLAILLTFGMTFALASCGGSASSGTKDTSQTDGSKVSEESMEFDENATEDPQVSDVEILNRADKYVKNIVTIPAMAKYEKKVDSRGIRYSWLSTTKRPSQPMPTVITKNGYTIKLGTPITQVEADGFVINDDHLDVDPKTLQGTFGANNEAEGYGLSLYAYNPTQKRQTIKECVVGGASFEKSIDQVDYQGITKDSKLTDIIEKFGIPSGGFEMMTYGKDNEATIALYYGTAPDDPTAEIRLKYLSDDNVSVYMIQVKSMGRF